MKTTQQLQDLGQSLWLDTITRGLLANGTLSDYIRDLSVTGLTSNPTIFNKAIRDGDFYDAAIRKKAAAELQLEGVAAFSDSWQDLLECLDAKCAVLETDKQA